MPLYSHGQSYNQIKGKLGIKEDKDSRLQQNISNCVSSTLRLLGNKKASTTLLVISA